MAPRTPSGNHVPADHVHADHVHADHDDHGSTPAAWTTVVLITLAFIVGTLAIILGNWPLFWVGAGLVVLGAIVGRVMQAMGLGKKQAGTPAPSD